MRLFRTKKSNRQSYHYYFVTGENTEIVVSDDVKASDIALLYQFDDEEINAEHRERYHVPCYLDDFWKEQEKDNKQSHPFLVEDQTPLTDILDGEDQELRTQLFECLHHALQTLTPKQKIMVDKIFYQGMSAAQVARDEKVYKSAISRRLARIYIKLEKEIKNFL